MLGLWMPARQQRTITRISAIDAGTARDRGLQDRPTTVAHHLHERASQTGRARPLMVTLLAVMIATAEKLATDKIALVPTGFVGEAVHVQSTYYRLLLAFALTRRC